MESEELRRRIEWRDRHQHTIEKTYKCPSISFDENVSRPQRLGIGTSGISQDLGLFLINAENNEQVVIIRSVPSNDTEFPEASSEPTLRMRQGINMFRNFCCGTSL